MTSVPITDESLAIDQPGSRFGGKLGAGAPFKAAKMFDIDVAANYNYISLDKDKFGISSLSYFDVHAGVVFHLMSK